MAYYPKRGDVIWMTFDPQSGREQAGHRPALVLSPEIYNRRSGLAIVCPITSRSKGYPYEVAIPNNLQASGVILADHAKSADWQTRDAAFICALPHQVIEEVLLKLNTLISLGDN